jgi:hypothetical protein
MPAECSAVTKVRKQSSRPQIPRLERNQLVTLDHRVAGGKLRAGVTHQELVFMTAAAAHFSLQIGRLSILQLYHSIDPIHSLL